ncbi:tetratricopeptide repeat-containing sensor histidine kinase [Paraflavitalea soli]|nr:sensor histidine kinase [Paraflavitalea soli]
MACLPTLSQVNKRDSLIQQLGKSKEDTAKVLLLCAIGEATENNEPETAKQYFRQAGLLSRKLHYDAGEYKYLYLYGNALIIQGNYDSSLYYQQQALAMAEKMKDSLSIGISLFNIGISYREMSSFEKAIEYCLRGRKIIDELGNEKLEMQVDDALQVLYYNRTNYDQAIVYGEKAVALARKLGMKEYLGKYLINVSLSYQNRNQPKKTMAVLEEALKIGQELQDNRILMVVRQNLAGAALKQHDYALTRKYAEETLDLSRKIGSTDGETTALRTIAVTYLQEGKLATAKAYAHQAMALSKTWNYKVEELSLYRLLSGIGYAEKDLEHGLLYDDTMYAKLEGMVKEVISKQSADLEKKYETEKKESRIHQLEAEKTVQDLRIRQKNIINYILIGGAATLSFIALLTYRNYRQKQALQQKRINELQTEKQLAATEAVLKGEEQERTRLAKDLHDGLGGMLSGIKYSFNTMKGNLIMTAENLQAFERGIDMLDSSINEMRRVAHNLMPEALVKFGLDTALRDFCHDINQSGSLKLQYQSSGLENVEIESNTAITVYRIVQELVNNVLKHAGAATAVVQIIKNETGIAITVEDDGKGFDTAILQRSKGIGWSNIHSRIDYLNGKMDIESTPQKGTSVLIELPV